MHKHYGLTDKTVRVRKKDTEATQEDPWGYEEQYMRVESEYPEFLRAVVLPHFNPHGLGISEPYRTCIHKNDISCGRVLINGGTIK